MAFKIHEIDADFNTIAKELSVINLVSRRRNINVYWTYNLLNNSINTLLNLKFLMALCGSTHYLITFLVVRTVVKLF